MKKTIFSLTLLVFALAACAPVTSSTTTGPAENDMPVPGATVTETIVEGKMPAPSFESQTYMDEAVGFAIEYPAGWTVKQTMTGERGSQSVLLSAPEIADLETLPAGATRVAVDINQWDPKNDLAAFVENRKMAWQASEFTIVEVEPLTLDLGLAAVRFTVQSPEGVPVEFLFAAIRDQYVTISGEGDLELVKEIMHYLRPIH
ncbi:MAG TPA: hypothetical protein VFR47_32365 [Anaerolineales bacterium]|nr:hypothetical protein [Anaerolineales bacterium]